jgi:hypothetical protein
MKFDDISFKKTSLKIYTTTKFIDAIEVLIVLTRSCNFLWRSFHASQEYPYSDVSIFLTKLRWFEENYYLHFQIYIQKMESVITHYVTWFP